jgi:DNA polymerase
MEGVVALHDREAAASLIRWWRDAGVDTLLEEQARAWLAAPQTHAPSEVGQRGEARREAQSARSSTAAQPISPQWERDEQFPSPLPALLDWLRDSPEVPEAGWGRTRVLPAGDPESDLMILIDAPDGGELIGGETGALFDKMLAAIGRDRNSIWLAPFATIRPVGRVPQEALRRLAAIAAHQIGLVAPKRLLVMGDTPSRALIGTKVFPARGKFHSLNLGTATVETVATFHPRLLQERPAYKAQAWKDLQLLMKGL